MYTGSPGQSHKQVASVSGIGYVRKAGYMGLWLSSMLKGTLRENEKVRRVKQQSSKDVIIQEGFMYNREY